MAEALSGLELRSKIDEGGTLTLSLDRVDIPEPGPDQVVVRVEGTPINPSDLGLLLGPADISTGQVGAGTYTAKIDPRFLPGMAARIGQALPVGNEGAGTVVRAGANVQHLQGKLVTMLGGAMYATYRLIRASEVMVLPDGATAADGASCFVNPLTALSMVESLRLEGGKALIHTAAASNLGQMLQKICLKDGVPLVNIVRSDAQAKILRDIGATYVLDSSAADFMPKLIDALAETGATMAFDAIGGGSLAGRILVAMEAAANRNAKEYSRYGSAVHKQVYIYGRLDMTPTTIEPAVGLSWTASGFLLTYFLQKIGPAETQRLRQRVMDELKTTFASHYTQEISLQEALQPDIIAAYAKKATGEKYLINPTK